MNHDALLHGYSGNIQHDQDERALESRINAAPKGECPRCGTPNGAGDYCFICIGEMKETAEDDARREANMAAIELLCDGFTTDVQRKRVQAQAAEVSFLEMNGGDDGYHG